MLWDRTRTKYPSLWRGCTGAYAPSLSITGQTFRDYGGRLHNGTPTSVTLSSFWTHDGVLFDNSNDYVDVATTPMRASGGPFALSWWEKIQSGSGVYPSRFFMECPGASRGLFVLRSSNSGYQHLTVGPTTTGSGFKATDAPSIAASVNAWVHFVIQSSASDSTTIGDWQIWANGKQTTLATSNSLGGWGNATRRIGLDGLGDSAANCVMDDIRFYDRMLTVPEIRTLNLRRCISFEKRREVFKAGAAGGGGGDGRKLSRIAGTRSRLLVPMDLG